MDTTGKFIVSSGSDDQQAPVLTSYYEAEDVARERSKTVFSGTCTVTRNGVFLVTYRAGKLVRCDLDAVTEAIR